MQGCVSQWRSPCGWVLTIVSFASCCGFRVVVGVVDCGFHGCLQRQFHRLVEMLVLKHMDPADERANRAYRLQVKERLYRFNYVRTFIFVPSFLASPLYVPASFFTPLQHAHPYPPSRNTPHTTGRPY